MPTWTAVSASDRSDNWSTFRSVTDVTTAGSGTFADEIDFQHVLSPLTAYGFFLSADNPVSLQENARNEP